MLIYANSCDVIGHVTALDQWEWPPVVPPGGETALDQSDAYPNLLIWAIIGDHTVAPLAAISARPIRTLHFKFQPIRSLPKSPHFWCFRITHILLKFMMSCIQPIMSLVIYLYSPTHLIYNVPLSSLPSIILIIILFPNLSSYTSMVCPQCDSFCFATSACSRRTWLIDFFKDRLVCSLGRPWNRSILLKHHISKLSTRCL